MEHEGDTRLCSRLELLSVYRTNLKIYSNVVVAARYRATEGHNIETLEARVIAALTDAVIPSNPLLSCVIVDGRTEKPCFKRLSIARPPVRYITDYATVQEFLRREHDEFPSNEQLWRVSILPDGSDASWISFAFHHAIGDGTSGLIFHNQLLEALEDNTPTTAWEMKPLPPAIEECGLNIHPSWSNLLKEVVKMPIIPSFVRQLISPRVEAYLGKRTSIDERKRTTTGLSTRKLSSSQVTALKVVAKANKISIHALLHAAVAHSIRTPLAMTSSTPISLRPLLPEEHRKNIANYISGHFSTMPLGPDVLSTAKLFYIEINTKESRSLALQTVGKLQYLGNSPPTGDRLCGMEEYYNEKLTTENDSCVGYTFEISNLGNVSRSITSNCDG